MLHPIETLIIEAHYDFFEAENCIMKQLEAKTDSVSKFNLCHNRFIDLRGDLIDNFPSYDWYGLNINIKNEYAVLFENFEKSPDKIKEAIKAILDKFSNHVTKVLGQEV